MPSADLPPHAATPAGLELRLLGPLEVRNGTKVVTVGGPRVRALLGVLLLEANRVVDLDRLVDALWEGSPPASTRQSLHFLVHKLRRSLAEVSGGGDLLVTRGSGYLLNVPPGALDAARFESGLAAARAAMAAGNHEAASHGFAAALALWRGQPLGGLSGHVFDVARTRLEELRIGARIDRVDAELELGRHADVLDELRALVAEQPLRERPQAQLMLALYRSGRQAEALDVARVARTAFVEDLGIEPGPELQRLEEAVRTRAAWLDAPARPAAPPAAPAPDRRELELGEERKVVTVLVVTLRPGGGPDAVDPEDARTRLATGLEEVDRQVRRFGGVVQAVVGGTAVAAFGVPLAHEDDPERAVRAALELCDPDRAAFEVQAGVETGEALVTAPADDGRHHGVVVGAVVDKAAALAATAPPGAVAVGPAVESATRRVMDYRQEGAGWLAAGPRSRTGAAERTPTASPLIEREQSWPCCAGCSAGSAGAARRNCSPWSATPGSARAASRVRCFRRYPRAATPGGW